MVVTAIIGLIVHNQIIVYNMLLFATNLNILTNHPYAQPIYYKLHRYQD